MAAEGLPAPLPHNPVAAIPTEEAALLAAEAETPQEPLQTARGSAATSQGESCCSEEFVLNCTFAACDPEQTGTVLARRVVDYLQAVTGHSGEEGRLWVLRRMLDPEAAGVALDLPTFHAIMTEWIASCRQEGGSRHAEEQDAVAGDLSLVLAAGEGCTAPAAAQLEGDGGDTDIASPTEAAGLRSRTEQLAARNAKLQRDAELAEELNARLAEETSRLKAQLRCSQQALEQARAATEELEDLKATAKGLEEENGELCRQARQLEKEQRILCSQADSLQAENQQLLAEGRGLREQIQALAAETSNLEAQLSRCTALLSSRDAALAQAGRQVEQLTAVLEEHDREVQELRLETMQLRERLGRMQDARTMQPWCPLGEADVPMQPLSAEIEATCRETGEAEEENAGMAAPGAAVGDGKEPAEPRQCPGPRDSRLLPPRALLALLLLALLALLSLLSRCWPGLPRSRAAWPHLQLCYRRPPPQ